MRIWLRLWIRFKLRMQRKRRQQNCRQAEQSDRYLVRSRMKRGHLTNQYPCDKDYQSFLVHCDYENIEALLCVQSMMASEAEKNEHYTAAILAECLANLHRFMFANIRPDFDAAAVPSVSDGDPGSGLGRSAAR